MSARPRRWIWMLGLAWIVIGAALGMVALSQRGPSSEPAERAAPEAVLRTLIVSDALPVAASTPNGPLHALLLSGEVGATPAVATVLSDENCQPDAQGYSHCLNRLEMPGGEMVEVSHTHRMSEVPCLFPGERVRVRSA